MLSRKPNIVSHIILHELHLVKLLLYTHAVLIYTITMCSECDNAVYILTKESASINCSYMRLYLEVPAPLFHPPYH